MRNKYRSDEIPLEIQNIVGQKFTFVVRISAKKFIRNPNADPSFEVIYVAEQFGKQELNLQINMNQPPSTSTPLQVTKDLPPLMPITDNTIGAKVKNSTNVLYIIYYLFSLSYLSTLKYSWLYPGR